jgi:hypothetical protein
MQLTLARLYSRSRSGRYRLLIAEYEVLPTYEDEPAPAKPSRLIYAEALVLGSTGG